MENHQFTLANNPADLMSVQSRLQAVFQASEIRPRVISAVNLALGEWIENVIQHAYPDGAAHQIQVGCEFAPGAVIVQVTDDGRPFDPCAYPEMEAAGPGSAFAGRGIHLIRHLMDRMEYERRGDRNVLRMTKNLA